MYCRNCGTFLDGASTKCTNCNVEAGQGNAYCSNCKAPTNMDANYCQACGTYFSSVIPNAQQKSKIAAGILGIFLGSLGIHNFYLGYTGKAIAQLLITVLTCGLGSTISSIWGLIEGILILTGSINVDANNVPLKD